ncbi:MAG: hypothetical protein ACRC4N_04595, partial [Gammaproteobacteria bacterium]
MKNLQSEPAIKNNQEHPVKKDIFKNTETCQELNTSKCLEEMETTLKLTKTPNVTDHLDKEKIAKKPETPISKSSTSTVLKPVKIKANGKTSQELPSNPAEVMPSLKTAVTPFEKQESETKIKPEHLFKEEIPTNSDIGISQTTTSTVKLKAKSDASQTIIINETTKDTSVTPSKKQASKTKIKQNLIEKEIPKNSDIGICTSSPTAELKSEASRPIIVGKTAKDTSVTPEKQAFETEIKKELMIKDEIPKNADIGGSTTTATTVELKAKSKASQPIISEMNKDTYVTPSEKQASKTKVKQEHLIEKIPQNSDIGISTSSTTVELKAKSEASQPIIVSETNKDTSVTPSKKQASQTKIKQGHLIEEIPKKSDIGISATSTAVELQAKSEASKPIIVGKTDKDTSVTPKKQASKTKNKQEHLIKDETPKNSDIGISATSATVELKAKSEASQPIIVSETNKDTSVNPSKKQASKTRIQQEHLIKDEIPNNSDIGISATSTTIELKAKSEASQPIIVSETNKDTFVTPSKKQTSETKIKHADLTKDEIFKNSDRGISTITVVELEARSEASQPTIVSKTAKDTSVTPSKK